MTVESLRLRLQRLAEADPETVALRQMAEALARFDAVALDDFFVLLGKVKTPAAKKPPRGKSPEALETKRIKDEEVARKKEIAARDKQEKADAAAAKKEAVARAKADKAQAAAEKKAAANSVKAQVAASVASLAEEIENFLSVATTQQPPQSVIDARIVGVGKLTKPELMELARLLKCDAGLPASAAKGKIVERIRDMVNRTIGTAARVNQ